MSSPIADVFIKFMANPKNVGRLCDLVGEMPNVEFPTLGGQVFWDTLAEANGYKLQKNKLTSHCRILDPEDIRIAWGSEKELLEKIRITS